MDKLPQFTCREVVARLEKLGFEFARQKGSHATYQKVTPAGTVGCVVPMHHIHHDVAPGTLRSILRQAHISPDEFLNA